jgi:electron transfer flavoprotein alpha/beta subunit
VDDSVKQALGMGLDHARLVSEASAMGLDTEAVVLAYARDYVDRKMREWAETAGVGY